MRSKANPTRKICGASYHLEELGVPAYAVAFQEGNLLAAFPRYAKIRGASYRLTELGVPMYAVALQEGNLLAAFPRYAKIRGAAYRLTELGVPAYDVAPREGSLHIFRAGLENNTAQLLCNVICAVVRRQMEG